MLVKNIPTYWSSTSSEIIIYRNNSGFAVANFLDILLKKMLGMGGVGWVSPFDILSICEQRQTDNQTIHSVLWEHSSAQNVLT